MVAPNRNAGGSSDDSGAVPSRIRNRLGIRVEFEPRRDAPRQPPFRFLRDVSRFALLFLGIALVNLLVLLLALWVLRYGATDPALPILDPIPRG